MGQKHIWKDSEEQALLMILADKTVKPLYPQSDFSLAQIRQKLRLLRSNYKDVTNILGVVGFVWNSDKKCIDTAETLWDDYVQHNNAAKKWRHLSYPVYERLAIIFGGSSVPVKNVDRFSVDSVSKGVDEHPDMQTLSVPGCLMESGSLTHIMLMGDLYNILCLSIQKSDFVLYILRLRRPFHIMSATSLVSLGVNNNATSHIIKWTAFQEGLLLTILGSMSKEDPAFDIARFNSTIFEHIATKMNTSCCRYNFQPRHIEKKLRILRSNYNAIRSLLTTPGFVWDATRDCVDGGIDDWNKVIKGANRWKNRPYPIYNRLIVCFGQDQSSGSGNNDCTMRQPAKHRSSAHKRKCKSRNVQAMSSLGTS